MNREDLAAYLLHEMPEEERGAFSEQWLSDPELHAELRAVEAELLDEYVRGSASARRRGQVEEWLLVGESQQAKLQFATSLHRRLRRTQPSWPKRALWLAAIAAGLIVAWLAMRGVKPPEMRKPPEIASNVKEKRNVFPVRLAQDDLRGVAESTGTIVIPPGTDLVRLDLDLDPADESDSTSVEVTGPGGMAWRESDVVEKRLEGRTVASVWLPSSMLNSGNYEVKLLVKGKAIAYYRMTILSR